MINIDFNNLNPLEKHIYNTLLEYSKTNSNMRITDAAKVSNCSVSKISKYVKKLGFTNFKQYLNFLYGKEIVKNEHSTELNRIKDFIDDFDDTMIDEFIDLINSHEKIILFGYGPSLICAQYFEYRLRICSNKLIVAVSDEISVASMIDDSSLLIILTVTGNFHSFSTMYLDTKNKGSEVAIVAEEYNNSLFDQCDKIFLLSKVPQPNYLQPFEKSRTIFFIFMEEIIQKLMLDNKKLNAD